MKNKEIEELLNKLKDNIPEDYIRSVDTKDGIGRYELDIDSWQYKLLSYIEQLEKDKEKEYVLVGRMQLKTRDYIHQLEKEKRQLENNRDKAIEFIEEKRKVFEWYDTDLFYLESLLKGDSDE